MEKLFFVIILFLIGCTAQDADLPEHIKGMENLKVYSADVEPNTSIEMVQEATFKAPDKFSLDWYDDSATIYNWLAGIEIDDSGRVFIADNNVNKIHVFGSDER